MIDAELYKAVVLSGTAFEYIKDREDINPSVKEAMLEVSTILANIMILKSADIDIETAQAIDEEIEQYIDSVNSVDDIQLPNDTIDKLRDEWDKIKAYNDRFSNPIEPSEETKAEVASILEDISKELGDM